MIACLRGELLLKTADRVIVDVGGVGYEVFLSQANLAALPEIGQEIFLHIYTNVREDALNLYGFIEALEKEMFLVLVGVSGIGPKVALNILSGIEPAGLASAILSEDIGQLTKLPGIGKKTAERLCLELKDKVEFIPQALVAAESPAAPPPDDQLAADVISALVNLGYTAVSAKDAVDSLRQRLGADYEKLNLQEVLRQALRSLA